MSWGLAVASGWLVVANLLAMLPGRDTHGRAAFGLITLGIPILGWVTWESGPFWGMAVAAAGAGVLRWPLVSFWRWSKRKAGFGATVE